MGLHLLLAYSYTIKVRTTVCLVGQERAGRAEKSREEIKNPAASERGMKSLNHANYVYSRIRNLTDAVPLAAGNQTPQNFKLQNDIQKS
jgi:hypothetical protein